MHKGWQCRTGFRGRIIGLTLGLVMLIAGSLTVTAPRVAQAATGDIIRSFEAQAPGCSVGVGIAFDGFQLLVSCYDTNVISGVSPVDGSAIRDYPVSGVSGIGAMSFDRTGNRVWICDANTDGVYTADLYSGASTFKFQSDGCFDGLAYDATDGTVWASGDASGEYAHYKADGTKIADFQVGNLLGGCGNSGLAVGAHDLFMANNGCSQIYRVSKDGQTSTLLSGYPQRLEDLECDDVSFPGTTVIWSKDAYDLTLNAFDVGAIDCGINAYRDSDADGISDTWESQGADIDGDGTIDLDLPAMGADPLHKDLFVEIDWLAKDPRKLGPIPLGGGYAHPPSLTSARMVTNAFKNMPVSNPDGHQGIDLHLDAGAASIMNPQSGATWGNRSRSNAIHVTDPLGTWGDVDSFRKSNVDAARRSIFHYVLYVDELGCDGDSCTTGLSRGIPGHDLLIARGSIRTDLQEAVTLAHELGHNLGLGHGGQEQPNDPGSQNVNEKANYVSIMNYFYSNTGLRAFNGNDGIISFSTRAQEPLYRDDLDETAGLSPDTYGHFQIIYRCPNGSKRTGDSWAAVDWNCDGAVRDGSSNPNIQNPSDVADYHADGTRSLGSEDTTHLYFWGTGSLWDARNESLVDFDQPGTQEPTIGQAKTDGVWWPDLSVQAPSALTVTVYPDTGQVSVPVTLSNPGAEPVTLTPSLDGSFPRFSLASSAPFTLAPNSTAVIDVRVDTAGLQADQALEGRITYSAPDAGALGTIDLTAQVPAAADLGDGACETARSARDAADLADYQAPALDAFLRTCQEAPVPTIDIEPGSNDNPINLRSRGVIPVALLSSATFDATSVDYRTLCFGDAEAASQRDCSESHHHRHVEDVNGDGRPDLLGHFDVGETGIDPGDTRACLSGRLSSGTAFEACDAVRVTSTYKFHGLLGLGGPRAINRAKAGRIVPLVFSLGGNHGRNIFAAGSPSVAQVSCTSRTAQGSGQSALTPKGGFFYIPFVNVYVYLWTTKSSWAGSCQRIDVALADGSVHPAIFRFR